MSNTIQLSILAFALAPLAYYLLSLYCVFDYFRAIRRLPPINRSFAPPVSIIKPVRNLDREAYKNFASFCCLDYPEYELIFAVADREDPVIPVIESLKKAFPQQSIRLVTSVANLGANTIAPDPTAKTKMDAVKVRRGPMRSQIYPQGI